MSSTIVIVLAAIGGIVWLGFILVAALRRRGPEEIPSNLAPGTTDDRMETRRLESGQKTAVLLSAFLAISLPLYFLGEPERQEGFDEQFDEESVERGEALWTEYACDSCHGPEGVGGSAQYVEKRSGVNVSWEAPSINDVFLRYDEEEVRYWITYGRGNTPMPAWGLDGGGPMNEDQIQDVINYLRTIQIGQMEAVAESEPGSTHIQAAADRLENGDQIAQQALTSQRQVLADIEQAPEQSEFLGPLVTEARELLDNAGEGIDTDGDGLSDTVESRLVEIGEQIVDYFQVIDDIDLDPESAQTVEGTDDLTSATDVRDQLADLVESGEEPELVNQLDAVDAVLDTGVVEDVISQDAVAQLEAIADGLEADVDIPDSIENAESAEAFVTSLEEAAESPDATDAVTQAATEARTIYEGGLDPDGDTLSTAAEQEISTQFQAAIDAAMPPEATVPAIDPANEATSGEPDADVASNIVAGWESLALNLSVTTNNIESIRQGAQQGIDYLEQAIDEALWEIDVQGVAENTFDGDVQAAERAVHLFQAYCARCHTAGYSAGVPFTLEVGSGGFGPALWDGRPRVQFGAAADEAEDDLLVQFIINGSEAETPYGLNGFGSGRMPAFGQILAAEDIRLLAQYLRGGNLNGMEDVEEVTP